MINLLRAEWIKLRTVTMNWVLAGIAVAFPLLIVLLNAFFRGDEADFTSRQLLDVITGSSFIPSLLIGAIAITVVTSEFAFGTIRPTFAATPRRLRVVAAKGVVVVVFGLLLQGFVVVVGTFVGSAIASGQGAHIDLGEVDTAVPALIGTVLLAGLMALMGLGLGMLIRSTPAAIAVFILWPLLAEALVGGLLSLIFKGSQPADWLPFRVGFRLPQIDLYSDGPGRLVSGLYFGVVGLAVAALGAWTVNRRDA